MTNYLKKFSKTLRATLLAAVILAFQSLCHSKTVKETFVYFKADEVNLRLGPNKKYGIKWVIKSKHEPVLVIAQFEQWTKVKDIDGDEGWVMDSLISTDTKGGIVQGSRMVLMYKRPDSSSKKMTRLQPRVRVRIKQCTAKGWCEVSINSFKGWLLKKHLWGVN